MTGWLRAAALDAAHVEPYVGRHRADTTHQQHADPGWLPPACTAATRQTLAPTYYADRYLHAGPDERTGLMPAVVTP